MTAKAKKVFSEGFDDVEELDVIEDKEGNLQIKGIVEKASVFYKVSIKRNDSGNTKPIREDITPKFKPLYTGTVSIISPMDGKVMLSEAKRRKKQAKGKNYKDKDIYATAHYTCNSSNLADINAALHRIIDNLFKENEAQISSCLVKTMRPEKAWPQFCTAKYLDEFLQIAYSRSSPERNSTRKRTIQKIFASLRNVPMCQINGREVSALIRKDSITAENVELCHSFWTYLLDTRKCSGKNPFPSETTRTFSQKALDKKAFSTTILDTEVFEKIFELINKKLSTLYCGVALLASGFTLDDISELKWSDIEFIKGYDDFAIVHIHRKYLAAPKHDFSRPAIPDTAKYMKKLYRELSKKLDKDTLANTYVVTTEYSDTKHANNKEIINEANNLLVRAGYRGRLGEPGRSGEKDPIPSNLLRTSYQRMLISKAGLKNDPDTASFLAGKPFNSSTYTNYESHTSPEAQYRLYTILKPLSVKVPLKQPKSLIEIGDKQVFTATPKTNHEVSQVTGSITIPPGEKILIRVPHGVTGRIE